MLFHLAQHQVNDPINIMGPVPVLEKKRGQRDNKIDEKLKRKYELEEKRGLNVESDWSENRSPWKYKKKIQNDQSSTC